MPKFSIESGPREPDGTVCVERRKSVDKTEKDQLKECFVQNVTQCYNTYITGKKNTGEMSSPK